MGGIGYSYDNKFNLTAAEGFTGTYDAANRLVSASNSGMAASPEVELVYDGLGRCVKRTIQGVATIIIYDDWKPIAEWDGWTEEYFQAWNVYGPGADEILLRQGGKWGYVRYHPDANGNVTFLLDNDGAVVEKYTYDVFGRPKITDRHGNPRASSHYDNRFLFQGREYIGEAGVYDYRNRFYHPALGRFLQKDPTGFDAGDMNLFRYCGDDPIDGSDPTGLDQDDPKPVSRPLTSSGGGDWDWFNGRVGLDQMVQPAGIIMAPMVVRGDEVKKDVPIRERNGVVAGFEDPVAAGRAGAEADYGRIDKSGIGGKNRPEYGGYTLRRTTGKRDYGYNGPFKGKQGAVNDKYRRMREANYLVLYGRGALPVPDGWEKIGFHYAHPIPGNTIPDDDKQVARDHGWIVVGAAPPLRRGVYYNVNNPMIEVYP